MCVLYVSFGLRSVVYLEVPIARIFRMVCSKQSPFAFPFLLTPFLLLSGSL